MRVQGMLKYGAAVMATGLLAGCSAIKAVEDLPSTIVNAIKGNWEMHATASQAANLPEIAGSFSTTTNGAVTGVFHTLSTNACMSSSTYVPATGAVDAQGNVSLTSSAFNGSVLKLTGQLSADGKSRSNASYFVSGGSCGFPAVAGAAAVPMTATQYAPISGNYAGSFTDSDGYSLAVTATLTQTSDPDANGVYHLSGNASFPTNPCLNAPVVADSTVSGNMASTTYTQTVNGAVTTIVANGVFSSDASTLTVTDWTFSGGTGRCSGTETGTGILTKQ
jgi:hypothetical protein